jgi:hypothetical protein
LRIEDLGPKAGSRKQERQQDRWRSPVLAQYYSKDKIRWTVLPMENWKNRGAAAGEMAWERARPAALRHSQLRSKENVIK